MLLHSDLQDAFVIPVAALLKLPFRVIGILVKNFWRLLTGLLLRPIYEQCHSRYLNLHAQSWQSLGDGLEYKLYLESVITDLSNPVSRIYIRNSGGEDIDLVEVAIIAAKGELEYP